MNAHQLYSITEVAEELNIDRGTVSGLVRSGKIGCLPLGKKRPKIPGSEVIRWERENLCRGSAEIQKALDGRRRS